MKTKTLMIGLALLGCPTANAQNTVNLQGDPDDIVNRNHIREMPIVTYDNSYVSIKSEEFVGNARVIIKDTKERVIYNKVISISPDNNVLDIPKEYVSDKFKIELSYDNAKLQGYFMPAK